MKHFSMEEWVDFLNQMLSASKKHAMESHLRAGCKRCAKTVEVWQRVQQASAMEESYQPPDSVVRIAKAAFAGSQFAREERKSPTLVEVLFDSALQPLVAGARSGASATRQMLFRADPYEVHVNLEAKPDAGRIVITGQLQNLHSPDIRCAGIGVIISNLRGHVVQTITNPSGEFCEEIKNSGGLELKIPGANNAPVIISVPHALGDEPRGMRSVQ
jgi:hypothetical protein